jgi:hypothetical protein
MNQLLKGMKLNLILGDTANYRVSLYLAQRINQERTILVK